MMERARQYRDVGRCVNSAVCDLAGCFRLPYEALRFRAYRWPRHSMVLLKAEAISAISQTQVASGTQMAWTHWWRRNQSSHWGSAAFASVARLRPFSMPGESCAISAHSARRLPRIAAIIEAAIPPQ